MRHALVFSIVLVCLGSSARADSDRRLAGEVNVLWPFFPGGLSDFKLLIPTVAGGDGLVGLHSDFGNRKPARDDSYGKVATLAVKLGYRQQLGLGLHAELTVNVGWRHEAMRPGDDPLMDDLVARAWPMAGYQLALSDRFYVNARGGIGVHLYRSSHSDDERRLIPAADINLGLWF